MKSFRKFIYRVKHTTIVDCLIFVGTILSWIPTIIIGFGYLLLMVVDLMGVGGFGIMYPFDDPEKSTKQIRIDCAILLTAILFFSLIVWVTLFYIIPMIVNNMSFQSIMDFTNNLKFPTFI